MPFQHSENLDDQNRSVLLFTELGDDEQLGYAKKHHDSSSASAASRIATRCSAERRAPTRSRPATSCPGERLVEAARFNAHRSRSCALYLESEGVEAVLFDTEINIYGGHSCRCG